MPTLLHTVPGDAHWEQFLAVPAEVFPYPDHQIGLKNQINHDFFFKGLLLMQNGNPVGRIGIYLNHELKKNGLRSGTLGNYEAIDDERIGKRLLEAGMDVLREEGIEYVIGPMNGSSWDQYRFELHPDRHHFFLEPQNPSWYHTHWKAAGFQVIGEYTSNIDRQMQSNVSSVSRIADCRRRGIKVRKIDLDRYEEELDLLFPLCLKGFSRNHLYTPITRSSFLAKYLPIKSAIDPEWVLIAENEDGDPGGFIFCFPDYWNQSNRQLVIKTLVRKPGKEWAGIGSILSAIMIQKAQKAGFGAVIHAMMFHAGGGKAISTTYDGEMIQEYVLLGREIGS